MNPERMQYKETIPQIERILSEYKSFLPLTIRQLFYQFVVRNWIANTKLRYRALDRVAVLGRERGDLPSDAFTDRTRILYQIPQYESAKEFLDGLERYFHLNKDQSTYIEVWCEKDALADIFRAILDPLEIPLLVCRGYSSYSALHEGRKRFSGIFNNGIERIVVLDFGDLDPSGLDISRNVSEGLDGVEFERVGLTLEHVQQYNLPPNQLKRKKDGKLSDSRAPKFIEKYGFESWELDALPPDVLQGLIKDSVMRFFDADSFKKAKEREKQIQEKLHELFNSFDGGDANEHS